MASTGRDLTLPTLRLLALLLFALHVFFMLAAEPIGDEAYYWLWGQHPALSYYDHPPLQAWLMGLVAQLFGWNTVSLRLLGWFTTAATLLLLHDWSRRLAPDDHRRYFWAAVAAWYASPMFSLISTVMFPDHLLVALVLWSAHHFVRYFVGLRHGEDRVSRLYLGAALLGLAGLTKYNALLFGLAVVAYVLSSAERRRVLAQPHIWLAGFLALAMQAPVIVWNLQNDLASYGYNIVERHDQGWLIVQSFPAFLISILIALLFGSFTLIWPMIRMLRARPTAPFLAEAAALARWGLVVSSTFMLGIAAIAGISFYWNIVAYIVFMPLAPVFLGLRRGFVAHVVAGFLVIVPLVVNYAVFPLGLLFADNTAFEARIVYGWPEAGAAVARARDVTGADFVASTRYTMAAQLGFQLQDPGVTDLSPRRSAFKDWFDPADHLGESAVILADERAMRLDDAMRNQFGSVELLETVRVERFGKLVNEFGIYLGRNYRGPQP